MMLKVIEQIIRKTLKNNIQNTKKFQMLNPVLDDCLSDSRSGSFCLPGHPWSDFLDSVLKKSNKWHQPHLQKNKQGLKNTIPLINPNI